ncbi:VOC family protein [Amorphoplanes digitatis]|uniref:Catechol 2,3-dioxygenase n=1 Tax=Actinoplanes digitatis TaxID=1868 RepID=A0A7W7I070_9ACTN|nr:VOC family protein [Actinoplanes digitatis]MBB4763890.1 catechol 2,3-dioxygenase [Actinoplanes digitatis]GID93709.1 catechol 2,3-dioxygenase [Actinoplanes digitatis]
MSLTHDPDRRRDIAHVGPIELYTPVLEESRDFFVEVMALREVHRDDDSVYLHTWDDYQSWTIRLVRRGAAGIGRTYLRAAGPEARDRLAAQIEATGLGRGVATDVHHLGEVYLFADPDGHEFGLYWDVEWYRPDATDTPALKNQAAAYPGRGANLRRLDHVNYLTADVPATSAFLRDVLGARCTEQIVKDDGGPQAVWYSLGNKTYDLVYTEDWTGTRGRLHHIAFATDTREEILRTADVCLDAGVHIETGPHKHAIQQTFFLYVWEPGGNRIEICNAGARLILAPDWKTISWTREERAKGQAWGLKTIDTFHTHGTPVVPPAP